jgi:hypothetical protein
MSFISRLYKGEYSLAKSYWLFGNVIPAILFMIIFGLIFLTSNDPLGKLVNQDFVPESLMVSIVVLILSLITLVYIFISVIGIWRSAQKYNGKKIWSLLAKITIIIGGLLNIKSFFKFF